MIKPSCLLMSIFAFLFLISFASALNSPDWREYSPQYTYSTNSQDINSKGFFNLGYSRILKGCDFGGISSPIRNDVATQLVTKTIGSNQFLVLTDDGFLSIYNSNFTKLSSIYSGNQVYSLSLFGVDDDTLRILGIFSNTTGYYFSVFDYDVGGSLTKVVTTLTRLGVSSFNNPSGIKCMDGSVYFGYNGIVCLGYTGGMALSWNMATYYDNGTFIEKPMPSDATSGYTPRTPSFLDVNNDEKLEVLTWNEVNLYLTYPNGTLIWKKYYRTGDWSMYNDAVFFKVSGVYKIAYSTYSSPTNYRINYVNLDGSVYNGVSDFSIYGGNGITTGQMSVLDWDNDGTDEIAVSYSNTTATTLKLFNNFGSVLKTGIIKANIGASVISTRLNEDDYYDFVLSSNDGTTKMFAFDLQNNVQILNSSGSFIPVDFNSDGVVDILGYNSTGLTLITSNYTNQNAVLNTLTFIPSITPAVFSPMTITIGASDPESDIMYYYVDCGNGVITSESTSSSAQCTYNSTGDAYLTAYVRDQYHVTYDSYSQTINVGAVSNETGEITQPDENTTTIQATNGGMTLPTQLVDTENINQGLLPEIYFGTLAFFSSILTPTIVLVFVIFFALIMATIGMIIKKIADKVGSMGR
jgi:hypothetical protein